MTTSITEPIAVEGARLAEVVAVWSLASDLGMGQPWECGLRATVLAVRFGQALGLSAEDLADCYYYSLLRWAGCVADAPLAASIMGDEILVRGEIATVDWGRPAEMMFAMLTHIGLGQPPLRRARTLLTGVPKMPKLMATSTAHCEVAHMLAGRLDLGERVQAMLLQAFERWDGKGVPNHVKGEQLTYPVRLVHVAHDAELFRGIGGADAAVEMVKKRSGGAHDPALAARFCELGPQLMADLGEISAWDVALELEPGTRRRLSQQELALALQTMGDWVDLKSAYMTGHSAGVAALAATAAEGCGLPDSGVTALRMAGYVHDLGRIAVSAGVWEKAGPLSTDERERVRLHPYYTDRLFSRSNALSRLGALAAQHHERMDGSGYHRGVAGATLPQPARLLAAADVYQALTQARPHRPALGSDAAARELRAIVSAGGLDADAANAVLEAAGHRVAGRRRLLPADLTEREAEVLALVARGLTARAIADRLVISQKTARNHIEHIYEKIGVSTRAAATLFAMQYGLVEAAEPTGAEAAAG